MAKKTSNGVEAYLTNIKPLLNKANNRQLFNSIVNVPFKDNFWATSMGLGVVVLLLVNKKEGTIDRVALSDTELAEGAVTMSVIPFRNIKIPLNFLDNYISKAIKTGKPQMTTDWQHLFAPALTPDEARLNQAGAAIACSFVYPLPKARDGGAMIFSYYVSSDKITAEHLEFMAEYSKAANRALAL